MDEILKKQALTSFIFQIFLEVFTCFYIFWSTEKQDYPSQGLARTYRGWHGQDTKRQAWPGKQETGLARTPRASCHQSCTALYCLCVSRTFYTTIFSSYKLIFLNLKSANNLF